MLLVLVQCMFTNDLQDDFLLLLLIEPEQT